jgi:hypothetical protein
MTPADQARNQAISLEAKKDALSQRQSGDWKVSFTVQGIDMDPRLTQAAMGTRFAMVLVEIGDNEEPVTPAAKEPRAKPGQNAPSPDRVKRAWREIPISAQAAIRCNEPAFAAYLREEHPDEWHETGDADLCLKMICNITSKTELASNRKAATLWFQIDNAYHAWLVKERVGA